MAKYPNGYDNTGYSVDRNYNSRNEDYADYKEPIHDYEQDYTEPEKHNVQYEKHITYRPICKLAFGKQRGTS